MTHNEELIYTKCGGMCTVCQSAVSSFTAQVHHIDGNHDNDDFDNLTTLCTTHHIKAQNDLQLSSSMAREFTPKFLKYMRDEWIKRRQDQGNLSALPEAEEFQEGVAQYVVDEMVRRGLVVPR